MEKITLNLKFERTMTMAMPVQTERGNERSCWGAGWETERVSEKGQTVHKANTAS